MPRQPAIGEPVDLDLLEDDEPQYNTPVRRTAPSLPPVGGAVDPGLLEDDGPTAAGPSMVPASGMGEAPMVPAFRTRTTADPSMLDAIEAESAGTIGSVPSTLARGYLDLNIGAAKGVGQTVANLGRLTQKVPGVTRFTDWLYGMQPGGSARAMDVADQVVTPSNTTQTVGKIGEQVAEAIVPSNAISRLGLKLASKAPQGLGLAARAGVEAAGAAGIATAQGADPMTAAGVAGALPVAGAAVRATGRVLGNAPTPVKRAAEFMRGRGVPVDAASATDSKVVRGAQWAADRTLGGSMVGEAARTAQEEGLARVGRELATEAYPEGAMVPEQVGQGIRDAVGKRIRSANSKASQAYGRLRGIEEQMVEEVPATVRAGADEGGAIFQPKSMSDADLFADVLEDAKRNGYDGPTSELRARLREKVSEAQGLVDEVSNGNWGRRVLQFISDNGGVGVAEKDLSGEAARLREMVTQAKANTRVQGAIGGVRGVVRPKAGLTVDQMMERFRAHPEFGPSFADLPDSELFNIIEEAAELSSGIKVTPAGALAQVGVRPGRAWWTEASALAGDGSEGSALQQLARGLGQGGDETTRSVPLPVDMRPVKESLRPVIERLERELPPAQQGMSRPLHAIRSILEGEDFVSASAADAGLSELKRLSRSAAMPELRNRGQGLAAKAVSDLETAVQAAVAQGGPAATAARNAGRAATKEKYRAAAVLKKLREEPVQVFNQAIWRNDTGIKQLESLAKVAPKQMRQLGRAYVDDLMNTATAQGRFTGGAGLHQRWQSLGPRTKALMFPDKQLRENLDNFFLFARKSAENPNPSGTAFVGGLSAQGAYLVMDPVGGALMQVPAWALSKFLHSRKGVELLTSGMRVNTRNEAAAGALAAQIRSFAASSGVPVEPVRGGTSQESRAPSPVRQQQAQQAARDEAGRFAPAPKARSASQALGLRMRPAPTGPDGPAAPARGRI